MVCPLNYWLDDLEKLRPWHPDAAAYPVGLEPTLVNPRVHGLGAHRTEIDDLLQSVVLLQPDCRLFAENRLRVQTFGCHTHRRHLELRDVMAESLAVLCALCAISPVFPLFIRQALGGIQRKSSGCRTARSPCLCRQSREMAGRYRQIRFSQDKKASLRESNPPVGLALEIRFSQPHSLYLRESHLPAPPDTQPKTPAARGWIVS